MIFCWAIGGEVAAYWLGIGIVSLLLLCCLYQACTWELPNGLLYTQLLCFFLVSM